MSGIEKYFTGNPRAYEFTVLELTQAPDGLGSFVDTWSPTSPAIVFSAYMRLGKETEIKRSDKKDDDKIYILRFPDEISFNEKNMLKITASDNTDFIDRVYEVDFEPDNVMSNHKKTQLTEFSAPDPDAIILENDQTTLVQTDITLAGMNGVIDWGDGTIIFATPIEQTYSHNYSTTGNYTIKITGALSSLTKIVVFSQTFIGGNIEFCKYLTSLITLDLYNTQLTGDISNFSNLLALEVLNVSATDVYGEIGSISNLIELSQVRAFSVPGISGDLASLNTLENLSYARFNSTSVSYSTAVWNLQNNVTFIVNNCAWTQTEVDNFIIDVAQGNGTTPTNITLTIDGTNASRSSASDDAVISIVDAGGTVTANGGSFGPELVVNGNMEIGDPPSYWPASSSTLTALISGQYEGTQSLSVLATANAGRGNQSVAGSFESKTFRYYGAIKSANVGNKGKIRIVERTSGDTFIKDAINPSFQEFLAWTIMSGTFLTDSNTGIFKLQLEVETSGDIVYFDVLSLREVIS